jgi:hypothetical protein
MQQDNLSEPLKMHEGKKKLTWCSLKNRVIGARMAGLLFWAADAELCY